MSNISFMNLISSKPIEKRTKDQLIVAYNKNRKIFSQVPNKKFKIIICNSEEEWKEESKYYYFPFGAGTVLRDGTLIVKEQKLLTRNNKEYQKLLDHEMNHVFFLLIYGLTRPLWIQEGLANFVGGYPFSKKDTLKKIKEKKISCKILQYRYLNKNFPDKETVKLMYSIWRYFVGFITNNNPKKITKFMEIYTKNPSKKNYLNLFYRFFKKDDKQKFEEFISWLN
ncbi:hypothetical protein J4465_01390 [Candidatus Pacearchaeota archaeon]|nr:hypothetical protein [Candidatus Pacearchaeota archaeon]